MTPIAAHPCPTDKWLLLNNNQVAPVGQEGFEPFIFHSILYLVNMRGSGSYVLSIWNEDPLVKEFYDGSLVIRDHTDNIVRMRTEVKVGLTEEGRLFIEGDWEWFRIRSRAYIRPRQQKEG